MKVLHVYSGNLFGGIETILVSIARRGIGRGAQHAFALCFEGRLSRELRTLGAEVHPLTPVRVSRPQTIRQARRALRSLLAASSWDAAVVHASWSHALFGSTIRRAGVPLAFWAHDAWRGRHWTERWARRTPPDLVIANSRFTASTLDDAYSSVPREVIYAPVDAVDATAADRAAIRRELATPASAVVVVQASRMEPWKGHATLLQALASHREDPRWHCWMIGGAQRPTERAYLELLQRRAAALGVGRRVSFCGERTDVPRLLAAADLYCQPNVRPEPFGIVFVEALAAGLPVAAAASGGALEILDDSCGRLVAPADADGWRATVGELIADAALRARLGASARGRAADLCDPASQRRHLDRAIETICHATVST